MKSSHTAHPCVKDMSCMRINCVDLRQAEKKQVFGIQKTTDTTLNESGTTRSYKGRLVSFSEILYKDFIYFRVRDNDGPSPGGRV